MARSFFAPIAGIFVVLCACSDAPEGFSGGERTPAYDTSPVAVENLAEDDSARTRVLTMTFGEVSARLTAFEYSARAFFEFSRGTKELQQSDSFDVSVDPKGNFHVAIDSGSDSVEAYLVGETVYVREDKGHLRKKPRRDATALEGWGQLAWTPLWSNLEPFASRIVLSAKDAETVAGVPTRRFDLSLGAPREALQGTRVELPKSELPTDPPALWRERAKPLDLKGSLWVATDSGVVVKSKFEGRVEIPDREVHPTQLALRFESRFEAIGDIPPIEAPKARREYSRIPRPVDQLSFFRDQLPKEGDGEESEKN